MEQAIIHIRQANAELQRAIELQRAKDLQVYRDLFQLNVKFSQEQML